MNVFFLAAVIVFVIDMFGVATRIKLLSLGLALLALGHMFGVIVFH